MYNMQRQMLSHELATPVAMMSGCNMRSQVFCCGRVFGFVVRINGERRYPVG